MIPQLYGLYPAIIGGLVINNVDSVSPSPGVESIIRMAGGSIDPQFSAAAFAEPYVKIGAHDLQAILSNVSPVTGLPFNAAAVQYEARSQGGIFKGNGNHVTLSSTLGCAWVNDFGATQDDKEGADINLTYACLYDGTNAPLVVNAAQNLTGSPTVNALHALGPVIFENQAGGLVGVTKVRVNTGMEYRVKRSDGDLFARFGSFVKRAPTIEIDCLNLGVLGTIGPFKLPITNPLVVYFQKVLSGGGRVAYNVAQHVSVTISAGDYTIQEIPVDGDGDATTRITVAATGTAALAFATATTITIP